MKEKMYDNYLRAKAIICCLLIIIDFVLTYIGLNKGVIKEGNPLLINFFNLSFSKSFLVRFIFSIIIFNLFSVAIIMANNKQKKFINTAINLGILINMFIFILHLRWILLVF